ncbi:hypothetical protein IFM89_012193 [Coptis chinensis]|uniref:NPH3 domain-containing protein n=1 Tax=Coptis chinensis TaxID=261450 RepID=A0A835HJR4_9MAGN|nr:hypothetical protein IFM89_012193 [Coptis chinensis]
MEIECVWVCGVAGLPVYWYLVGGYEESKKSITFGYEFEGLGSPSHGSVLKVGRLIDAYLAEIAPDPYLDLCKFIDIIEILLDYARVIDDGLYRATDIY